MSTEVTSNEAALQGETDSLEEFGALLKQNFRVKNEAAETEVEKAVNTLVKQALSNTHVIEDDVYDTIDDMIAELDKKLSDQLNEVLHHETFQQIESSWRGLNYLCDNSETDASLKIKVMNASKNELFRNLRSYKDAKFDQSPLFKKLYETEFGQLGGQPYGCLVGDYHFDHSAPDISLMRNVSKIAAAAHCPFIAGAAPSLMRMESWTELSNPRDLSKVFDTPEYAGWRGLRDSENARYLGLCMPKVLSREPYGSKSVPVDEFNFEEETDGHEGTKYGWMNAAYAMAANINRAHKEHGWTVQIRGVKSGGEVINLPVHTFPTDDGSTDLKCPTEIAITDRREAEISKAGLLPLIHRKNSDKAAFIGAQSVFKPRDFGPDKDLTASDNLSSRLPYMFATARFAHYLKCMVRDNIGRNMEKDQLQRWLHDWIMQYVDGDPKNSSEADKAKRPLADAKIEVFEDEENPGYYGTKVFLRPHFQLEGMDISLSLVSRLPQKVD